MECAKDAAAWCQLCEHVRASLAVAARRATTSDAVVRWAFGVLFPGLWRGYSNFSPIRSRLLVRILGPDWYNRIYKDPKSIWLTPKTFAAWQADPAVRSQVAANLQFWMQSPQLSANLSIVGWCKLLQAAYDFDLMDHFATVWSLCQRIRTWSPTERALAFQVY